MNNDAYEIPMFFSSVIVSALAAFVSAVGGDSAAALGWCSLGFLWIRFFVRSVDFDPPCEENGKIADGLDAGPTTR